MASPELSKSLFEQISQIPTVDAHEHLHAEEMRVARKVDIFLLFHQYLFTQLIAAGMDPKKADALGIQCAVDPKSAGPQDANALSLDEKWEAVAPYLDFVRTCSCARPPFEALKHFFGESDLTARNYASVSARMQEHNRPGLFDRCLRQACNIVLVLNQNRTMWHNDLFKPILPEDFFIGVRDRAFVESMSQEVGQSVPSDLPQYVELMEELLTRRAREGMIGVKGMCYPYEPGDAQAGASAYPRILAGGDGKDRIAVANYLRDRLYEMCGRLQIVVVKHSGVWAGGWSDQTTIRPTNLIPVAMKFRNTRFDLFHAGTPWPADAGLMARALPNIWLNLCWSHLISPALSEQALEIWLDMVPTNRVMAFGGDYWWAVENVYGALMQTREIVAAVLARRVGNGSITESQAMTIARRWFHDNPREAYRV
ncbi:MAG: amidohydrolase family protein [Planctomycetota bacterium]